MDSASPTPPHAGLVMVVDDEPENLNLLEFLLAAAGYRVAVFPRGKLLLAAALETLPDLVLLDICMPDMDGYDVCFRFKADGRLAAIPIIFMSGLSEIEDIVAGYECGGVDYITKPFREVEVLARVHTHIALHRAYATLAERYAQLAALERQRDTLVHMLVHDMRSPLQVILGHLQLIETNRPKHLTVDDLEDLRKALDGTRLLARMVSTTVDLSRMESGDIPLRRVVISVHDVFQAARAQAANPANHRNIAEDIAAACPALLCDVDLSVRIVANLLANALKHSPKDGEIALGAEPDPSGVRIWVRDQGPGIPSCYHERIFEKFGVADQPRSAASTSTGLGLAFCKLAVQAQGGAIGVESATGQGSTFWFTLPAAATPPSGVESRLHEP